LGLNVAIEALGDVADAPSVFADALPVLPISVDGPVVAGHPDPAAAPAVLQSIERAVSLVRDGAASAAVTNPISKATLTRAGFGFPGHTEFLAVLSGRNTSDAVMMLVGGGLRVVPVTIHMPLKTVIGALTEARILATLKITARDVARFFGLPRPRIAVTGLNPHAGEQGTMGSEEIDIIAPAVEAARREGLDVSGPYPADTMFHADARRTYDVAVAMYHDQALIPVKTLAFDTGVNVTLGLPFVRTSPDHGTAFALAGTGKASPRSLIEALRLAETMARNAGTAP
jgi:4-hydroxythreonine-4-phosphate dehydrogenase